MARIPEGPLIWGNVPQRNRNFTGRENILAELRLRMNTVSNDKITGRAHAHRGRQQHIKM